MCLHVLAPLSRFHGKAIQRLRQLPKLVGDAGLFRPTSVQRGRGALKEPIILSLLRCHMHACTHRSAGNAGVWRAAGRADSADWCLPEEQGGGKVVTFDPLSQREKTGKRTDQLLKLLL